MTTRIPLDENFVCIVRSKTGLHRFIYIPRRTSFKRRSSEFGHNCNRTNAARATQSPKMTIDAAEQIVFPVAPAPGIVVGANFSVLVFVHVLKKDLMDFLKLVDSLDLDGANRERTRLHLFQFSLRDQASNWLKRLPAGSITTWEDLTT
ncbi:hypothetical protein Tco_1087521 [Tanacetum coccineum]